MQHQQKFRLNIAASTDHRRHASDGHDQSLRQISIFGKECVIKHQLLPPVFAFLVMSGGDIKVQTLHLKHVVKSESSESCAV
jgi:hypothetical protein